MYVKCFNLKGVGATKLKAQYLGDLEHSNHAELESIERQFHGLAGRIAEFNPDLAFAVEAEKVHERRAAAGRPIEITAWHWIVRAPEKAELDKSEKEKIIAELLEEFGNPKACSAWHNHRDGASDLHVLALNRDEDGNALKGDMDPRMRRKLIAVMDRVHDEINAQRKKEGRPLIETMKEARRRIASEKGLNLLAEMIVDRARQEGLSEWCQIKPCIAKWITEAGHKVTRNNDDIVSVKYQGTKKAKRHRWDYLHRDVMGILGATSPQKSKVSVATAPSVKVFNKGKVIPTIGTATKILVNSAFRSTAIPAKTIIPSPREIGINPPPLTTADLEGSPKFKQLLELGHTPAQAIEIIKQDHEKKHALKQIDEEELRHLTKLLTEEKADKERLEAQRQEKAAINKGIIQGLLHIVELTENPRKQPGSKKVNGKGEEEDRDI